MVAQALNEFFSKGRTK